MNDFRRKWNFISHDREYCFYTVTFYFIIWGFFVTGYQSSLNPCHCELIFFYLPFMRVFFQVIEIQTNQFEYRLPLQFITIRRDHQETSITQIKSIFVRLLNSTELQKITSWYFFSMISWSCWKETTCFTISWKTLSFVAGSKKGGKTVPEPQRIHRKYTADAPQMNMTVPIGSNHSHSIPSGYSREIRD